MERGGANVRMKAFTKSGPWFGIGMPKYPATSYPCWAAGTEYWYLYDVRPLSEKASASQ